MSQLTRKQFRSELKRGAGLILPGVANALAVRVVADCGFNAAYVTGAGIANSYLGIPDNGLVTLTELADHVTAIRAVFRGPLMVDADTGFGNALNMRRTIEVLERAGADAIQIEDQVFPKRCGHFEGKEVIPAAEMVQKIKAAVDSRADADLLIVARTDAIAVEGFNAAIDRAHAFKEAGADIGFVEAPTTPEQMAAIAKLPWPQLANIVIGGKTPEKSNDNMKTLGFAGMHLRQHRVAGGAARHAAGAQAPQAAWAGRRREGHADELRRAPAAGRHRVVPGPRAEIQMTARVPVLIVGGGPVGLALAGELGWRGVPCTLIEKTDGSIEQPKMDLVGIRTMEFCRRWGILDWVRDAPYPLDYPQDYVYVTALNGYELGREPFPGRGFEPCPPESPQKRERVPQDMFDPILRRFAERSPQVELRNNCELVSFSETPDGVSALRSAIPRAARPKPSRRIIWSAPTAARAPCASSSASA